MREVLKLDFFIYPDTKERKENNYLSYNKNSPQ